MHVQLYVAFGGESFKGNSIMNKLGMSYSTYPYLGLWRIVELFVHNVELWKIVHYVEHIGECGIVEFHNLFDKSSNL
jgi:hypothetical protein